jgi:DNA polymerase III delta subunit
MQIKTEQELVALAQKNTSLAYLFYGQDDGLIDLRSERLLSLLQKNNAEKIRISYSTVEENPENLLNEIFSPSLFSSKKIIEILDAKEGLAKLIEEILPQINTDITLVIKCENLTPASSLRKLFEAKEQLTILPCYKEDERNLIKFVQDFCMAKSLKITTDTAQYIVNCSKDNKLILTSSLEKIELYKAGDANRNLSIEEAEMLVSDLSEFNYFEVVKAIFSGNAEKLFFNLKKAREDGIYGVSIIRAMLNHLRRLYMVLENVRLGDGVDEAMAKLFPRVFFKEVPIFKQHLAIAKKKNLMELMEKIINTEIAIKLNNLDEVLINNLSLSLLNEMRGS